MGVLESALAQRIVPVAGLDGARDAEVAGRALIDSGLAVIEVVLRAPGALAAVRRLSEIPGLIVGAGTILSPRQVDDAMDAGAHFLVSPGLTESVALAARDSGAPILPGASTATELMRAQELGFDTVKFFPAEAVGGAPALRALAAPFPGVRFVPTGGISLATMPEYLALDSVRAVGGGWLTPPRLVRAADVDGLARVVRDAMAAAGAVKPHA